MVLKGKTNPETRLSTTDLQVVPSNADISGTQTTFLHFYSNALFCIYLMTQAPASACCSCSRSLTQRVCVCQPLASLISSRMTDGAITQKRRSWRNRSDT